MLKDLHDTIPFTNNLSALCSYIYECIIHILYNMNDNEINTTANDILIILNFILKFDRLWDTNHVVYIIVKC